MDNTVLAKFPAPEKKSSPWISSLMSLLAYLLVASLFIRDSKVALILIFILLLHELGHYLAMRHFRYHETGIFFIPLLGAFVSGSKRTISQQESATIILAGPLPGILVGIVVLLLSRFITTDIDTAAVLNWAGVAMVLLNGFNLLPVYPLDGGQLLNRVFFDEESTLSRIFVVASALLLTWLAFRIKFYALLLFPLLLLWRTRKDRTLKKIEERIEASGIDIDMDYEELPDEDYWKIRAILIELHPRFASVDPSTRSYDSKEEAVQTMVSSLLQRKLIMDLSLSKKIMIATLWMAALLFTALFGLLQWGAK
ncbi:MAG: site-2 protease family protein [Bacteroidetes bacterium]|nr:site-2 protease family protein [Bacteroidota bacterium]